MSTATLVPPPTAEATTLTTRELLDRVGDVPLYRICATPTPGTATEQDALDARATTKKLVELVGGVLVEKPMGYPESVIAAGLIFWLKAYLLHNNLGAVGAPDSLMRLTTGLLRQPDVSFVFYSRLPGRQVRVDQPIADLAPDVAVEVVSTGNTPAEIATKTGEYFQHGTSLVWIVDPRTRTVEVFTSPTASTLLQQTDTLDGGAVLPGFSLPLAQLFAELDPH